MMLADWLRRVEQAPFQLRPGNAWPDGSEPTGRAKAPGRRGPEMTAGQVAGVVVVGAATLVAASALVFWCFTRRRIGRSRSEETAPISELPADDARQYAAQPDTHGQHSDRHALSSTHQRTGQPLASHPPSSDATQRPPVELPGSADPGNSPLPPYDSAGYAQFLQMVGERSPADGHPRFSWDGKEAVYRSSKTAKL